MLMPRENLHLFAHQEARETFLKSFHCSRFPHAWILTGPYGVGKTTFAFHMARYILSGRHDYNTVFSANDPLYRRILSKGHGDLWAIGEEDTQEIGIEAIRDLNSFLNQTSAEGGWRIIIIDNADKLNRNAGNALLKKLEEPPAKTVFFLITSLPGRLLPTIRSRCQLLVLSPLSEREVCDVCLSQNFTPPESLSIAQGSPGRLMRLMEGQGADIYANLQKILKGEDFISFIHTYGGEDTTYSIIEDLVRTFLYDQLLTKAEGRPSFFADITLEQALNIHEKVEGLFDQCRFAQLDRKVTLTCVFSSLGNREL